jgi:hypothetical protein
MEASQLRRVILGKLRDQTLPRDASFANTITRAGEIVIREAQGEPCSICGEASQGPGGSRPLNTTWRGWTSWPTAFQGQVLS